VLWFDAAMRSRLLRIGAASAASLVLLAGCGGSGSGGKASGGTHTLRVYAASSLTKTFQQIAKEFEHEHEGVNVDLVLGGSSDLVEQLQQGAPGDVFASADTANMDKLTGASLNQGDPQDFATNTLEIAVPPGNPAKITSFADLAKQGVQVDVCAPEVPCGAATVKVEQVAGVTLHPVSQEQAVTDVLAKVSSGEADAGLVYVTDVKGAGGSVEGVPFPQSGKVVNTYPVVALKSSKDDSLAKDFVGLVTGSKGQSILRAAGFAQP
jgi:molybdate transport system substrate-binding protein